MDDEWNEWRRTYLELADLGVQREGVEKHGTDERDVGGLARKKRE